MLQVGERLGRYEVEKRCAVEKEDYDLAKEKKQQMEHFRSRVYEQLQLHELVDAELVGRACGRTRGQGLGELLLGSTGVGLRGSASADSRRRTATVHMGQVSREASPQLAVSPGGSPTHVVLGSTRRGAPDSSGQEGRVLCPDPCSRPGDRPGAQGTVQGVQALAVPAGPWPHSTRPALWSQTHSSASLGLSFPIVSTAVRTRNRRCGHLPKALSTSPALDHS